MYQAAAGRRIAALLSAFALIEQPHAAHAQETGPPPDLAQPSAPLDPSAPLAPMPDIGVEWPSLEPGADASATVAPNLPSGTAAGVTDASGATVADAPAARPADPALLADTTTERAYTVAIEGLDPETELAIRTQFDPLSTLREHKGDETNAAQIDRRAREDSELLSELLRARGYYDAAVETEVEAGQGANLKVVLHAEPGPLYRFAAIDLPGIDQAGDQAAVLRQAFGVNDNDPVDADKVIAAQAALAAELGRRGFAFAEIGALDIAVDHATHTASLTLPVTPNGERRFGRILIQGRPLFTAEHIQTIARFHAGEMFRADRLEDLRRALIATGLVSSVNVKTVAAADPKTVDIAVSLERAPMRTVSGELGYGTGEGARLELSWQHRNLLRPEGAVTFHAIAGTQEQLLGATLRRNNFLRRDQVLTAQIAATHINRPAYGARTFQLGAGLERQTNFIWQKVWTWSAGGELVATDERDVDISTGTTRRRTFFIAALPGSLSYDGSNDLLDPTRGFRLSARLSPELSLQSGAFGYARTQIDGSVYHPVTSSIVLAGRARLGTIVGASRDQIAPSRRFYSGGGGSVRGFGYQRLGPRDPVFDDPIGGRSLAEFSVEARIRRGNWGLVPFLDGGNIYTASLPDLSKMRFGAGLGVRYHTRFGPIRVDVGTPISRRSGDPRIAVYVGIGQAF
jgi:translocation and assembly module TamA